MAPSITETLFALGCGDRLVGVTDFCEHPPQARELPKVGGYINPNFEAVLRLKPELVVAPIGAEGLPQKLRAMGLKVLEVDHRSVDGVFQSLTILGEALGVKDRAQQLLTDWQSRLDALAERYRDRPRPRVLMIIDRPADSSRLQNLYAVGRDGFLDRMIELAGGQNVLSDAPAAFPILSAESVLRLDPEVIVDIQAGKDITGQNQADLLRAWQQVRDVTAVRTGRVYILGRDVPVVPGPRMIALAEALARCFHPTDSLTSSERSSAAQ